MRPSMVSVRCKNPRTLEDSTYVCCRSREPGSWQCVSCALTFSASVPTKSKSECSHHYAAPDQFLDCRHKQHLHSAMAISFLALLSVISGAAKQSIVGTVIPRSFLRGACGVEIKGDFAFVTGTDEGITAVNISNPASLVAVSGIKDETKFYRPCRLGISSNYAYVLGGSTGMLTVVSIADPSNLAITLTTGEEMNWTMRGPLFSQVTMPMCPATTLTLSKSSILPTLQRHRRRCHPRRKSSRGGCRHGDRRALPLRCRR